MVASTSRRGIEAGSLRDAEPVGEPSTSAGVARELAQDATAEELAAALRESRRWAERLRQMKRHVHDAQGPGERRPLGVPEVLILDQPRRAITAGTADDGSCP